MHLLDVKNLRVRFETHHGTVHAVDGVTFHVDEGETLGLVGESGSGKSVTNLALMGLIPTPPGVVVAERVMFGKRNLFKMTDQELRKIRGNEIAMIFQDPMTSLNPLLTIERQLSEVLMLHKNKSRREARALCAKGLGDVGIPNPEERLDSYPHELSGGMRQRVMIAMALLCNPRLLIADEPTTALDVTIQAQILELMKDMQKKNGMAIIFVTHDLGVVAGMTDRVNVMYAGRLAESAPTEELFARPQHPYTHGLLASVPTLGGDPGADLYSIPGSPPDLADLPTGCAFGPRCNQYTDRCNIQKPTLKQIKDAETGVNRRVACFEISSAAAPGEDVNKELFAELERQEREGTQDLAVTWTAPPRAEAEGANNADEVESALSDAPGISGENGETESSARDTNDAAAEHADTASGETESSARDADETTDELETFEGSTGPGDSSLETGGAIGTTKSVIDSESIVDATSVVDDDEEDSAAQGSFPEATAETEPVPEGQSASFEAHPKGGTLLEAEQAAEEHLAATPNSGASAEERIVSDSERDGGESGVPTESDKPGASSDTIEAADDPFALDAPEDSALDLETALNLEATDLPEVRDEMGDLDDENWRWIGQPPGSNATEAGEDKPSEEDK